jgi:hypothetical protein
MLRTCADDGRRHLLVWAWYLAVASAGLKSLDEAEVMRLRLLGASKASTAGDLIHSPGGRPDSCALQSNNVVASGWADEICSMGNGPSESEGSP